jgi:hypothetical protein
VEEKRNPDLAAKEEGEPTEVAPPKEDPKESVSAEVEHAEHQEEAAEEGGEGDASDVTLGQSLIFFLNLF